jgi:hypothetical protein
MGDVMMVMVVVALTVTTKKEKNRSSARRSTQGNDDGARESTEPHAGHDTTRHIAAKRGLVKGC